jgi:eukaryotic-like serine/threonine-protein kinase
VTLLPGTKLGAYEVVALIGAGGMGEVYRGRDTRLDRLVAIKILPAALAADAGLRDRFEREARAISSLSHPHICALFDVGRHDGTDFLVLELLEGETLAQRLAGGPIPPAQALTIAIQICDALDKAHRSGIVHRDLKPANVMLTKAGAKLLDFGLAKGAAPVVTGGGLSMLPTTPANLTAQGTILGTFQYMAPEQIEGLEADARTDIFAFGALLFEMLTGRPAFEGKTRASLLGAILKDEPPRTSSVQPLAPKALDRILATCLAKDPDDRYQSARDLLRDLKWIAAGTSEEPAVLTPAIRRSSMTPWLVAGGLAIALLAAGTIAVRHVRETPPAADAIQFTIPAPENTLFGGVGGGGTGVAAQLAVSPDGRHVVFMANGQNGWQLWLRPLAGTESRTLPGTEEAAFPFWSPDSRFVAFFAGGKLKKVQISGGPPIPLCDAGRGLGGTWSRDNIILFSTAPESGGSGIRRVSAAGGPTVAASVLDTASGETSHRWPYFLPDGRHFLFTSAVGTCCPASKPSAIRIGALDSKDTVTLFETESSATYTAGHVLFSRAGTLMAQRFDPGIRQLTGDPFPVADRVPNEGSRYASFSVSENGVLVYARGAARATTRLTWFDRAGNITATTGAPGRYLTLALAPDDRRVAVSLASGTNENRAIWILDSARGGMSRMTFDAVDDTSPVWSPDGSRIAFHSVRPDGSGLRQKSVSGAGPDDLLVTGQQLLPTAWSQDGRFIAYGGYSPSPDIWVLPLTGDRKPFAFAATPFAERNAAFSPDGKWIAYQSSETGQYQVYVQPVPATGRKSLVSINGGEQPTWRADGKEIFFLGPDSKMMVATVGTTPEFESGVPQALFASTASNASASRQYAVSRDGKRFLVNARTERYDAAPLTVVVNWLAAVQK